MPDDSIREKVLKRLNCVLANIRSGTIIEACNALPDPFFEVLDGCDDQDSVDGWVPSGSADTPTLNTTTFFKAPGAINIIKLSGAPPVAILTKTLDTPFDATTKLGSLVLRSADVSQLHGTNAAKIKFGTDASNYFLRVFGRSTFQDNIFIDLQVGIDDIAGTPATIVGSPDITQIQFIEITIQTPIAGTIISEGDLIMDYWSLLDPTRWIPVNSGEAPEVQTEDPPPVVGVSYIGFGRRAPNIDLAFGIAHFFPTPLDLTAVQLEAWMFAHDKTVLNPISAVGSLGIILATTETDFFAKTLFYPDILDRINDITSGWNQILFRPETESDLTVGSPDIENIVAISILGFADADTTIPVGDFGIDFIRLVDVAGAYRTDVKQVYRYKIGTYQTMGTPIIMMAALNEKKVSKVYPLVHNTLTVGIDCEIELADEAVLDKELGKLATDIEIALAAQQTLWGVARYVEPKNWEFSVKEGTSTGILTGEIEIEYVTNQLDPTKQGL